MIKGGVISLGCNLAIFLTYSEGNAWEVNEYPSAETSADTSETTSKMASCLVCGMSLQTKAALAKHHREVHSSADVSSETSVGSSSTGGQNNDASVARVACEKCGRTFKNKSNLKIHMLTHSGLKPFG